MLTLVQMKSREREWFWVKNGFIFYQKRAWSLICNEKPIVLFEKVAMQMRSQRPLHVQGDASHLC
jgi:hypothetical protein